MLNDEIRRAKLEYKALLEEQANGINLNKSRSCMEAVDAKYIY